MKFFDTHTHLYLEQFDNDRNEVVRKAIEAGVDYMMLPNIDLQSVEPMQRLAAAFPKKCFATIGLHPSSVDKSFEYVLNQMEVFLKKEKFYAIGETGIDLYWDKTFLPEQEAAFIKHIEWALTYNLPLIIHSRNSFNEIVRILKTFRNQQFRGVFHCFPGNIQQAETVIKMGFCIGVGGVVTYKNSGLQKVVQQIPLENIVLETDSPFLPPVPHRGKRNESAYIPLIANVVAELKGLSIEYIAKITTENALKLFKISSS